MEKIIVMLVRIRSVSFRAIPLFFIFLTAISVKIGQGRKMKALLIEWLEKVDSPHLEEVKNRGI